MIQIYLGTIYQNTGRSIHIDLKSIWKRKDTG